MGTYQTILRAEVTGTISAFRLALQPGKQFWIWTDNALVHKRVGLFALDSTPCNRNRQNDHDLWSTLFALVRQAKRRELFQGIIKVSSHQQMGFSDVIERWAFQGHESADHTAASARQMLPPMGFWAWTQFDHDLQIRQKACEELHSMLVQFGLRCVETKVDQAERDEQNGMKCRNHKTSVW